MRNTVNTVVFSRNPPAGHELDTCFRQENRLLSVAPRQFGLRLLYETFSDFAANRTVCSRNCI